MAKNFLRKFLGFIGWLTGIIVSLAVAFGMIDGILTIRFIPPIIMMIFGWIVIITTVLGMLIGIMSYFIDKSSR